MWSQMRALRNYSEACECPWNVAKGHVCLVMAQSRGTDEPAASHQKGILPGKAND